jgi:putative oxygen-independent coproporphyrinogen III oxidase
VSLGIYISVPFCRTKCTYCNFASGVFSRPMFAKYVDRLCAEIASADKTAVEMGGEFDRRVDSVYLGGGTPSVLAPEDLLRLFEAVRQKFEVAPDTEITVECAPGTLNPEMIDTLLRCGVSRVSLGVQSFVDEETRSVARLHTRETTLNDIERLRGAGITNINVDLIAGLPHQTAASWEKSLEDVIASGVPHTSVYMLEIDEDSRLGHELIAGGTRYHAHFVPDEDLTADLYIRAVQRLNEAEIRQYEISNFARPGFESRHNLKYWTRQPYLGFGVDAHSMLEAASDPYVLLGAQENVPVNFPTLASRTRGTEEDEGGMRPCAVTQADLDAVRFSTPDSLDAYLATPQFARTPVSRCAAREEEFFLGLRLNHGVDLAQIEDRYGLTDSIMDAISELVSLGLLEREGNMIRLTERGRLLSNEVFQRFIAMPSNI